MKSFSSTVHTGLLLALLLTALACAACGLSPAGARADGAEPLPVRVLILPKFEIGAMTGDVPGEAQLYYERYLLGSEAYEVPHCPAGTTLYYRDGVALCVTGMGKLNAALTTMAVLSDARFDFSQAWILSTGCAGSAAGTTVMGDVFVITAAVDYDLGHHADARDLADPDGTTWFRDAGYDSSASILLDRDLTDRVYALVRDTPLATTERTRAFMRHVFDGEDSAVRDPMVLRGTAVTGDNYWKGTYGHENALLMAETYACPDPYAVTEMEDLAVAQAAERMGMLDRLIVLRVSVNLDVFMPGVTPESLWGGEERSLSDGSSVEAADIFGTAMRNVFDVSRILIDLILEGGF